MVTKTVIKEAHFDEKPLGVVLILWISGHFGRGGAKKSRGGS